MSPAVPCQLPLAKPSDDKVVHQLPQDSHQGHDPHSVQVLGSTAGSKLRCGAAAEWRGHAGQGQGSQRGGDGTTFAQLGQV